MNPKNIFLIVLAVGLVGVLVTFLVMKMGDTKVTPNPQIEIQVPSSIETDRDVVDEDEDDNEVVDQEESDSEDATVETSPDVATSTPNPKKETTTPQPVTKEDTTKPLDTEDTSSSETQTDTSIASRIENEKVTHYYNDALDYGMLVPRNNYYSGFGPQDGSRHTVGYNADAIPDTLDDAQVRVYYYGTTALPELANSTFYQDPSSGDTYLKIDDQYVRIETDDLDSPTLKMIIETIYVGENQAPKVEEETEVDATNG